MKTPRLLAALLLSLQLFACGTPDTRSFEVENLLFEQLLVGQAATTQPLDAARQARIAAGLSAICQGQTAGTPQLLADAAIGKEIYRLALIASKANRKGSCDYSDWPAKQNLLGERFKQLVGSGDAPSVLLAALLDEQLPAADRQSIMQALADKGYGHAQVFLAASLLRAPATPESRTQILSLLDQAARQGAMPAHLLQAQIHRSAAWQAPDPAKACASLQEAARLGSATAAGQMVGC